MTRKQQPEPEIEGIRLGVQIVKGSWRFVKILLFLVQEIHHHVICGTVTDSAQNAC